MNELMKKSTYNHPTTTTTTTTTITATTTTTTTTNNIHNSINIHTNTTNSST